MSQRDTNSVPLWSLHSQGTQTHGLISKCQIMKHKAGQRGIGSGQPVGCVGFLDFILSRQGGAIHLCAVCQWSFSSVSSSSFFFFGDRRDFIAPGILIRTSQFSCLVPLRKPSSLCLLTDFSLFLNTRYFAILNSIIPSSRRLKVKRCQWLSHVQLFVTP